MATKYLHGSLIPRAVSRRVDHRCEPRSDVGQEAATLEFRRRKYEISIVNRSASGAMVIFRLIPYIGETIKLHLDGVDEVSGRVCWVRDGKIGIEFASPVE